MPIVFCSIELHLPYCHSLKEKRNLLRKALDRTRHKGRFSVSEIGHHDLWQRARLGAVSIGPDGRTLEDAAERLVREVESSVGHEATRYEIELIDYD